MRLRVVSWCWGGGCCVRLRPSLVSWCWGTEGVHAPQDPHWRMGVGRPRVGWFVRTSHQCVGGGGPH